MSRKKTFTVWMIRADNKKSGVSDCLVLRNPINSNGSLWFNTKRDCKEFIDRVYGYIRTRKDLRSAPHSWRMPTPVKVRVTLEEVNSR